VTFTKATAVADLAQSAVEADLASPAFLAGVARGWWRLVSYEHPALVIAVKATEPDFSETEYHFRYELNQFPTLAPTAKIWDPVASVVLPPEKRPKGNPRVEKAFQSWGDDTVYRAWERVALAHSNWATAHPHAAWKPSMTLTNTLEDLHALLDGNARKAPTLEPAATCG
jgi:hypothetical protein